MFVRGFRVVRFLNFWPRLRGQATPSPDVDDRGPQPGADRRLSAISGEAGEKVNNSDHNLLILVDVLQYQDPLHVLLQYIAEVSNLLVIACEPDDNIFYSRHLSVRWLLSTMTTSHSSTVLYAHLFIYQSCTNSLTLFRCWKPSSQMS